MTIATNILNQGLNFYDTIRELDNHVNNTNDNGHEVEMVLDDGSIVMIYFNNNTLVEA